MQCLSQSAQPKVATKLFAVRPMLLLCRVVDIEIPDRDRVIRTVFVIRCNDAEVRERVLKRCAQGLPEEMGLASW